MAIAKKLPPISFLARRFEYEPKTGIIRYGEKPCARLNAGDVAGFTHWSGYRCLKVTFEGQSLTIFAHRLAWVLFHKRQIPEGLEIDHINRERGDNRISNLRVVTRAANANNRSLKRGQNRDGHVHGVAWISKKRRWVARPYRDGRYVYLGRHMSYEDAVSAITQYDKKA